MSGAWQRLTQWRTILAISIVLLLLTFNPVLVGFLPYIRAGWPAARTAYWLKAEDPWKARGTVGCLFHLCMALFQAGVSGFICVIFTIVSAEFFSEDLDLTAFAIAMITITFGCFASTILCWFGIVIALRHRVRMFVSSRLHEICRGDFALAKMVEPGPVRVNPGSYLIAVATATPVLFIWFVAMLTTISDVWGKLKDPVLLILLLLLPILALLFIPAIIFLSGRIMASSPAECWRTDGESPVKFMRETP